MDYVNRIIVTLLLWRGELAGRARRAYDERGSVTTEQAIVTAGIVVLALASVAILTSLVLRKVNAIDLDTTPPTTIP